MDITIIITNFNRANLLPRAIRSCLNQVVINTKIEVIVIDDCSTDSSLEACAEFAKHITILKNCVIRGVGYCSDQGVQLANGRYIMRVDSDDFISPFMCTILKSALDADENRDFAVCDHIRINSNGEKEKHVKLDNVEAILRHGAGIMFKAHLFEKFGSYNVEMRHGEDYELLTRFLKNGVKSIYIPIPLYRYYINKDNLTLLDHHNKIIKELRDNDDRA